MLKVKSKSSQKNLVLDKDLLDILYPVGAIYITTNDLNPSSYLGGTWTPFAQGLTLVGAGYYNDGEVQKNFVNMEHGGKFTQPLRALIGAYDGDIGALGYRPVEAVKDYDYRYGFHHGSPNTNISVERVNHSTLVLQSDGSQPTTIQPYIAVNMWRRIS